MDDLRSQTGIVPIDRSATRPVAPVQAGKPVTASRTADGSSGSSPGTLAPAGQLAVSEERASVSEFVEVHARVADILSDLDTGTIGVEEAADALIPKPIVFVPLPPASREAVEHAETVAKRIVERASYSHNAHASVSRAAVTQVAGN